MESVKDYGGTAVSADTGWYNSTQGDGLSIRNVYSGTIYNTGGVVDFTDSGTVNE